MYVSQMQGGENYYNVVGIPIYQYWNLNNIEYYKKTKDYVLKLEFFLTKILPADATGGTSG